MGQFVAEYTPTGREPDGSDQSEQATYWAQANAHRWTQNSAKNIVPGAMLRGCSSSYTERCLAAGPNATCGEAIAVKLQLPDFWDRSWEHESSWSRVLSR
jgi:hypothetical protein